ncbi:MAG: hypothetical protein V7772_11535 [Pseudomonas profundi]|uniref:hypothetical protein n=1 Tax=Pseudomonas profundi TaxID=1981513 RepID=UPI003001B784
MKVTGFDKLQKELKDAQRALRELDGELGVVNFNAHDPASIESAVNQVNQIIDQRAGRYASNPIVGPLILQMKEKYRAGILQKAAEARLQSEGDM